MADAASTLTAAYQALQAIGPPVRLASDPDPGGDEVLVIALVSDTTRHMHGGGAGDVLLQVSSYAATTLRALDLDRQVRERLAEQRLHHRQARTAPDPDGIGVISEFNT